MIAARGKEKERIKGPCEKPMKVIIILLHAQRNQLSHSRAH